MPTPTLALLVAAVVGVTVWSVARKPPRSVTEPASPASTPTDFTAATSPRVPLKETDMTHLTIIGAGNMGKGHRAHRCARRQHRHHHRPSPDDAKALADEVQSTYPNATIQTATLDQPLTSNVIVLATWYTSAQDLARQFHDQLTGKIVVDISNPLTSDFTNLAISGDTSAAEELAKLIPDSRVVKAFNTTFAGTLVAAQVAGQPLDVLIAGNDQPAKTTLIELVNAGGLRGLDAGGLERTRQLEGLGFLGIQLQFTQNTNFASAWKFLA